MSASTARGRGERCGGGGWLTVVPGPAPSGRRSGDAAYTDQGGRRDGPAHAFRKVFTPKAHSTSDERMAIPTATRSACRTPMPYAPVMAANQKPT